MNPGTLVRLMLEDQNLVDLVVAKIQQWAEAQISSAKEDPDIADAMPFLVDATASAVDSSVTLRGKDGAELAKVTVVDNGGRVTLTSNAGGESHRGVFTADDLTMPDSALLQDEVLLQFLEDHVLDNL